MKWYDILFLWVFTQIGNWFSYLVLGTPFKIAACGMFFSGAFALMISIYAKVKE